MAKEIHEQPESLLQTMRGRIKLQRSEGVRAGGGGRAMLRCAVVVVYGSPAAGSPVAQRGSAGGGTVAEHRSQ